MKRIALILIALTFSMNLAAAAPALNKRDKLRIGVIQSLSGFASEDGQTVVNALLLAEKELKAKGSNIELIIEDDQSSAKNAVAAFHKLRAQNVDAVIGGTWSYLVSALMPLAKQYKLPLINASTPIEAIEFGAFNSYGFTNALTVEKEAEPFEKFIKKSKPQNVTLVYVNNTWGVSQLVEHEKVLKQNNISNIHRVDYELFGNSDWGALLLKIKRKAPDLLVLLMNKPQIDIVLRRAREINFQPVFYGTKNVFHAYEDSNEKKMYEGVCFAYPIYLTNEENEFTQNYLSRYKEKPRIYADSSYDSLFLVERSFRLAKLKDITIPEALSDLSYVGLTGEYKRKGQLLNSANKSSLVCVQDGLLKSSNASR